MSIFRCKWGCVSVSAIVASLGEKGSGRGSLQGQEDTGEEGYLSDVSFKECYSAEVGA